MAKAFEDSQETFLEKFLVSGVPWRKPQLTFLSEKGVPKNFAQNTHFIWVKAFEIPKDFSRKVLWSGLGAYAPTDNAHKK